MITQIEVSWKIVSVTPRQVTYTMNGKTVGNGDTGFDQVLTHIRENPHASITIRGTLMDTLGGGSFEDSLPFQHRLQDLYSAAGGRNIAFTI
jgi:hypothetical protein